MAEDKKEGQESLEKPEDKGSQANVIDWSKVDWAKVDPSLVPEDLVKKSKAYTKVLDETIERRKELKTLKDTLSKLSPEEDEDKTKKLEAKKPDNNAEVPEWFKPFADKLSDIDRLSVDTWRDNASKVTGIKSPTILASLQGKTQAEVLANAEKIASELGIAKPDSVSAVGNITGEQHKALQERVRSINRGEGGMNVFSPNMQKEKGGGVLLDE